MLRETKVTCPELPNAFSPAQSKILFLHYMMMLIFTADFLFAPSQWETPSQSNDVSHWLCASLESAVVFKSYNIVNGKWNEWYRMVDIYVVANLIDRVGSIGTKSKSYHIGAVAQEADK